jgi:uncharacterized YccA/Bax inhibitor family protein
MPNPILSDKSLKQIEEREPGWAAPDGTVRPQVDDTVSPWEPPKARGTLATMTIGGTASATVVLLVLLLIAAVVGWNATPTAANGEVQFPGWSIVGVLVGFGCVIGCYLKPNLAKILAPVYALAQGVFLGAISKAYESWQNGIVVQAIGATLGVFAVMLFLYSSRILKVTDRMRRIIIGATVGLMLFYLVSLVIQLFTHNVPFFQEPTAFGILFSVGVVILAAFNLALDFDIIERASKAGAPKQMEWVCALGLVVTLVWLYLEILRLLSKLQSR